jgi:DNA-binding transcriptional MerR regulator
MSERDYLSIGEVLAQLLEEFPDVTISKIRFLESQGLIEPERTPSGYRKFTISEVERLRYILREQKNNFVPLRIIKDRLEDDTSDISRELRLVVDPLVSASHPAARASVPRPVATAPAPVSSPVLEQEILPSSIVAKEQRAIAKRHADRTESIPRDQLMSQDHISPELLKDLEAAGLVNGHDVGDTTFFDPQSSEIARIASRFSELGVEVRHLRGWRTSAERELSLFEQRILPLLRQRNPQAREQAVAMLDEFESLGGELRRALLEREIARLTEQR